MGDGRKSRRAGTVLGTIVLGVTWAARLPGADTEANGCIACHQNAPGALSQAVVDWRRSVHAENGVTCEACHGGEASIRGRPDDRQAVESAHFSAEGFLHRPRPATKVSYFCGRCHVAIKEKHLGSPHGENVHPTCIYCHGHHRVRSSSTSVIEPGRCTVCHDFRNAAQIRKILEKTEKNIILLEDRRKWLEENGYQSIAMDELHQHSRSTMTQLRVAFHSFNLGDVMNFASQLQAVLDRTDRTVEVVRAKEEAKHSQTFIGVGISLFLFVFAVLLIAYKRRYLDRPPAEEQTSVDPVARRR